MEIQQRTIDPLGPEVMRPASKFYVYCNQKGCCQAKQLNFHLKRREYLAGPLSTVEVRLTLCVGWGAANRDAIFPSSGDNDESADLTPSISTATSTGVGSPNMDKKSIRARSNSSGSASQEASGEYKFAIPLFMRAPEPSKVPLPQFY